MAPHADLGADINPRRKIRNKAILFFQLSNRTLIGVGFAASTARTK
jgi:hypothetical protein